MENSDKEPQSKLLKVVEAIAISPEEAKKIVKQYREAILKRKPKASESELKELIAKKIVKRYSNYSGISGGITSLSSVVPGVGTAISVTGGALADASYCMKIQVDMCMCLAETFEWDVSSEDARQLSFLIAAGGALEKAGSEVAVQLASKAGVNMLKMYLKGPVLVTIKELFMKIGFNFTRKALEKSLPFGIGVAISSSANYALTRYVGYVATQWFTIELDSREEKAVSTDIISQ